MSEETSAPVEASAPVETSNPIESSEAMTEEVAGMEAAVHEGQEVDASEDTELEASDESTEEHSEEVVDEAAEKIKAKEVKGSEGQLFKIKVEGQELEVTQDEMVRLAQMGKSGQKAMQERAEMQKQVQSFVEALRNDPKSVLAEDLGIDVTEFAQQILADKLEEEALDPAERRARAAEAKLERMLKEQEDYKKRQEEESFQAEVLKYEQELEAQVQEAFEESKLPKKPIFLSRMADLLEQAYSRNLNVTPKQVAKVIKEDWLNETKGALGSFDDDQLEAMLGSEIVTRLRKSQLRKVKTAPSLKAKSTAASTKREEKPKKAEKIEWKDFLKKSLIE